MMKGRELGFYKKYQPQFALSSSAVLTVSEYSKKDIHEKYLLDLDDIFIVYNGSRFEKNRLDRPRVLCLDWGFREENNFFYQEGWNPGKIMFGRFRLFK